MVFVCRQARMFIFMHTYSVFIQSVYSICSITHMFTSRLICSTRQERLPSMLWHKWTKWYTACFMIYRYEHIRKKKNDEHKCFSGNSALTICDNDLLWFQLLAHVVWRMWVPFISWINAIQKVSGAFIVYFDMIICPIDCILPTNKTLLYYTCLASEITCKYE